MSEGLWLRVLGPEEGYRAEVINLDWVPALWRGSLNGTLKPAAGAVARVFTDGRPGWRALAGQVVDWLLVPGVPEWVAEGLGDLEHSSSRDEALGKARAWAHRLREGMLDFGFPQI